MIKKYEIDYSHFTGQGHNKGKPAGNRRTAKQILVLLPEGSLRAKASLLRRALKESGVQEACNQCGLADEWNGKFLQLEINHVDGNYLNCLFENLEFICPNCHSQEAETNLPHKNKNKQ